MKNLGNMLKQAQEMQGRMAAMQEELERREVTGASAAGMVMVTLNGKGVMRRVKIDPVLVKADEAAVLEDLIVAAHNDAKQKVEAEVAVEMSKLTGGIELPAGLKLPF